MNLVSILSFHMLEKLSNLAHCAFMLHFSVTCVNLIMMHARYACLSLIGSTTYSLCMLPVLM